MNIRKIFVIIVVLAGLTFIGRSPVHATAGPLISSITVGGSPDGVVIDTATGNAYVTDIVTNNVTIISGTSNVAIGTIQIQTLSGGGAFDSLNREIYFTNSGSNTVSVVNDTTNKIVNTITVGLNPGRAVFDSTNLDVYVSNFAQNTVSVIDGRTNNVNATILVGNGPAGLAFDPTSNEISVANFGSNTVSIIDGSTNSVTGTVYVGYRPDGATFDSASGDVYISNYGSNSVSVIDGSANTIIATVPVGLSPEYLTYASDNNEIYVTNRFSNTTSIIYTPTNSLLSTIAVGANPRGIAFNPINGDVYVANNGAGSVSIIQTTIPSLQLSPMTGPIGTKVLVQGTNIPTHSVEVTFDDAFVGTTLATNGAFNFTFDVPQAQLGLHDIKAIDQLGNILAKAQFTVTPSGPSSLTVSVTVGTIYFPGDTVVASILVTSNGVPASSAGLVLQINVTRPDNSVVALGVTSLGSGLFRGAYPLPKTAQIGTYAIAASARSPTMFQGSSLVSFEVKLPWLSSQGSSVAVVGAVTSIGTAGVVLVSWRKGYFKRTSKETF